MSSRRCRARRGAPVPRGATRAVPLRPTPGSPRVGHVCGRYASSRSADDLVEEFEVVESRIAAPLAADYNVAPTKEVYAVVERPSSSGRRRATPTSPRSASCGSSPGAWCRRGRRTPPSATG
ncbi:SOS response-associated peptidase family protein [Nocardioides sp. zg-1228]|uniref:SOS response-associated peptidase family protein n=1 Tax=Nocardioides sp. zg-1228 TaxID=2763008 RepID=UPI003217FDBB